jgi:hypothetical protein
MAEREYADISTLVHGVSITDGEMYYKTFKVFKFKGKWTLECTGSDEGIYFFEEGDKIWVEDPPWLVEARKRSKERRGKILSDLKEIANREGQ